MNKKIILIDTIPITLKSTEINDYISKCILTYLHEPMFYQINGQYFSKYIRDYISSNFLIFEICDFFWSNGEKMSIQDIYNSILFILENKGLPSYYLDFIIGVDEYLVGKKALNEVSIFIQDDKLFCMLKDEEIDYHEILSLVQFSPLYIRDDKVYWNITTGRYKIDNFNISDCIILKKNLFHPENNYDYLMFKVIKNPTLSVNYFLKNPDVLMTCSTSFPYNKIEEYISNEQFVKLKSNIRIFF